MSTDTPTLSEALEAVMACEGQTPVTLANCPIGLFMAGDELCLKTEYGSNEGSIDAYIVSSGEFFWGSGPQTIASQRQQLVVPVDFAASANLARHAPAIQAMVEENDRLRREVERLSKPQFYWDVNAPDIPWDGPFEYIDQMRAGVIKEFSTGNATGKCFAVYLPPEDDADTDDEWTFDSTSQAETAAALAAELARREARSALKGPHHD